ncbi:MAG: HPr family phosphocarrier protein [Proteobacteria bacterium]|nr:HPr family phosphocarrier protein [Pseudomonadota bacterium]
MNQKKIFSRQAIVINEMGMHARPAAKIAQIAMEAVGEIRLSNGASVVDATSIIDILTLCAIKGSKILIKAESDDDRGLVEQIKAFFDNGFGELENE